MKFPEGESDWPTLGQLLSPGPIGCDQRGGCGLGRHFTPTGVASMPLLVFPPLVFIDTTASCGQQGCGEKSMVDTQRKGL